METHLINSSIWVTPAPPQLPRAYSQGRPIICKEKVKQSHANAFLGLVRLKAGQWLQWWTAAVVAAGADHAFGAESHRLEYVLPAPDAAVHPHLEMKCHTFAAAFHGCAPACNHLTRPCASA